MKHQKKDNEFSYFVFEGNFRFTGSKETTKKLFDEYAGDCTVYGVRADGSRAVVDKKTGSHV